MVKGHMMTASKAKKMLSEGMARGHKLTKKQKKLFGLIAGGGKVVRSKRKKRGKKKRGKR